MVIHKNKWNKIQAMNLKYYLLYEECYISSIQVTLTLSLIGSTELLDTAHYGPCNTLLAQVGHLLKI